MTCKWTEQLKELQAMYSYKSTVDRFEYIPNFEAYHWAQFAHEDHHFNLQNKSPEHEIPVAAELDIDIYGV